MDKLRLLWLEPKVQFQGKGIITAWGQEMEKAGWEIVRDPEKWESCDLIFYGSDSQLKQDLLGKKPSIVFFWGWPPQRLLNGQFRQFAETQLSMVAQCTRVLAPSPTVMDQLACFGIQSQLCIPGVDASTLGFWYGSASKESQIMYLSRIAPEKQPELVLYAASAITPSPKVLFCGPGDTSGLEALAKELGVPTEFKELSDAEKVQELRRSAVLIHSSRYEGFGLPPLEALLCGTPVIAFDTPQSRWLLQEDAYYFSSIEGLAQSIVHVFQHYDEVQGKAQHGAERVGKSLTLAHACDRLWAHIHQTIKEYWGERVKSDPLNPVLVKEAYEFEHRRNYAYGQQDVAGYNGPARFDPTWARHFRSTYFISELNAVGAKRILDIGSGPVYGTIFARAGFQVTAFDVSEECLSQSREIAQKWGVADKVLTQQGYAEEIPCPNDAYDGVILGEILEHVADPAKVVAEAMRVLKPSGVLIASTPFGGNHWDPFHCGPIDGGWDDKTLNTLLEPWKDMVKKVEKIAEEGTKPSCFLIVLEKKT